jgi:hypothetical protein
MIGLALMNYRRVSGWANQVLDDRFSAEIHARRPPRSCSTANQPRTNPLKLRGQFLPAEANNIHAYKYSTPSWNGEKVVVPGKALFGEIAAEVKLP